MRSPTGRPLVADFGISRIVDSEVSAQSTELTLTPAYSPPESLSGAQAEPSTDVYALGATLFGLIEGHPPFVDPDALTNLVALIRRIADDPVPRLTADAPAWIDEVIAAAMTKDPGKARPRRRISQSSFARREHSVLTPPSSGCRNSLAMRPRRG